MFTRRRTTQTPAAFAAILAFLAPIGLGLSTAYADEPTTTIEDLVLYGVPQDSQELFRFDFGSDTSSSIGTVNDAIATQRLPTGEEKPVFAQQAGHFATPVDHIRSVMSDFPGVTIHKGWIPDVLSELPETAWSFVHIDVDLFEPTKACLEYFLPRLAPGGVIVNDDFGSPLFPGGQRSWHEVMESHGLSYAVLDTGQAVYLNQPSFD